MAVAVIMPKSGQSVESCIITKWHKKEGDKVALSDKLFSYETDKASFTEEAKAEGVLLKILRAEEDDVKCLSNVCVIGKAGEDISAFLTEETAAAPKKETVVPAAVATGAEIKAGQAQGLPLQSSAGGFVKASPRAKNLAKVLGVDVSLAVPTGAEGRVMERDVNALAKNGVSNVAPAAVAGGAGYTEEKISNMRKIIAKAMLNSLQTTAQLTHTSSFDATKILDYRKSIKPKVEKGEMQNITINDIIMFVTAKVLKNHKLLNAHLLGDTMRYFNGVNLAMAVDTEKGLLVPVLFNADKKSLSEISAELKKLAESAQKGNISPDLLSGGSFTVSNLGVFGIESFTPILNAPQTGILGVNTITTKIKEISGGIKTYQSIALSLTYDHRAMDGAAASKFLKELCGELENFNGN